MRIFKRGKKYYSYEFELNGKRYKKATKCTSANDARNVAAAERMKIIRGEAGIEIAKKNVPTFREFRSTFLEWVNAELGNLATQRFYRETYDRLLRYDNLANKRLHEIDERVVEGLKLFARVNEFGDTVGPARINRLLQTLKKALRYARDMLKLIDKVPVIRKLPGEKNRDYIFSEDDYSRWIALSPPALKCASILARWSGICRGEMIALQKDCVTIFEEPDADGFYGEILVKRGLKRDCRRRSLKVNLAMRNVLRELIQSSRCDHIFSSPEDPTKPLKADRLSRLVKMLKQQGSFHRHAGLHALRHTFLTEMGEVTDPYTLQRIAGHSNITTTMRYVHPQKRAVESAFQRLFGREQSVHVNAPLILELAYADVEELLGGQELSFQIPPGKKLLRIKSTQKPPTEISTTLLSQESH